MTDHSPEPTQLHSGVPGLDELLRGGYLENRMYLVTGAPGSGKTTLCTHFLRAGLDEDETVLFVHGEESAREIRENAAWFGIDLSGAAFLDLGPDSDFFVDDHSYDLVDTADVDGDRFTEEIREAIEAVDPDRLVLDPITQLRYVESSEYHYRKRLLALIRYLKERGITVLGTATDDPRRPSVVEVRSVSDGVISLTRTDEGRRIAIEKNRGIGQREGDHGMEVRDAGVEVFPRLSPTPETDGPFDSEPITSGVPELDRLTGGGFPRGTVTFITGPPGVGKTTVGTQFLIEAAREGTHAAIYLFEERAAVFRHRCRSIGLPVDELERDDRLVIRRIEPGSMSAEEFAGLVRTDVVERDVGVVMIDGFTGYSASIQGDPEALIDDLHALTRHLDALGVGVFVTDAVHRITGLSSATSAHISAMADNVVYLTYVELDGSLGRVIGVLKKRTGPFQTTIREFAIGEDGLTVGEPLRGLHGILQGAPTTPSGRWNDTPTTDPAVARDDDQPGDPDADRQDGEDA